MLCTDNRVRRTLTDICLIVLNPYLKTWTDSCLIALLLMLWITRRSRRMRYGIVLSSNVVLKDLGQLPVLSSCGIPRSDRLFLQTGITMTIAGPSRSQNNLAEQLCTPCTAIVRHQISQLDPRTCHARHTNRAEL